ncbi:hypothetical protein [Baekduia sp.]|uniref:hypothetical protein n=1 Tax=Baekduia sp. TaxID=2600305 RepID=UPI002DFB4928|nr:hypothetical protein [Baekduia sp.]
MRMLFRMRRALVAAASIAGLCALAPAAHAAFGVSKFDAGTCTKNTEPAPQCTRDSTPDFWYATAGGHPQWGITDFAFNTAGPLATPDGNVLNVHVDLPVGLSVNPEATPKCTTAQLEAQACPANSEVGTNYITTVSGVVKAPIPTTVYNMVQPEGMPARFGMTVPVVGGQIYLDGGVAWDSDYHESFTISNITDAIPLYETRLVFNGRAGDGTFITMPSGCTGPATTGLQVDSHQAPGQYLSYSTLTPIGASGCADLPFAPTVGVAVDTRVAGAPSGVTIDVGLPHNPNGKDQPDTATLRDAHVTLPEGMTINPSAATGLAGCTDEQLGKGTTRPVSCPAASAIGTVDFETPVLPAGSLTGTVYLGQPLKDDPQSGDKYRMFLVAESPRYGVSVRLVGHVVPDPQTGRLTASFTDNPQVPVSLVRVALRGGDRATLVNPPACGRAKITGSFSSWGGQTATATNDVTIDQGCERAGSFAPGLAASVSDTHAGKSPSFALAVTRPDGDQALQRIDVNLPPGLLAKPAGIPLCGDAQATAGTCPETSRIGSIDVSAGAGPSPFALGGRVYLTGPYAGGPYGLSIVVPAVAGPFDLGLVVVRASVQLDRNDAHVRVLSDPLPTILDGVPLLLRSARVTIDRPDTMRNPTSCAPLTIGATLTSVASLTASPTAPFAATGCDALAFSPKTKIALTGATQTSVGKHPGVDSTVTQAAGQANIQQVQVTLPLSLALDPDNAQSLCEFVDGARGDCPQTSVIGSATARTPLLDHPISGKVYFVKGVRIDPKSGRQIKTLPTLLVQLRGDIALDLRASTTVDAKSRLVTTFAPIPDAAVSSFRLTLAGGKHGILTVTNRNGLCTGAKQQAALVATGHNGKRAPSTVTLDTPCSAAAKLSGVRAVGGGRVQVAVKATATGRVVLRGAAGRLGSWSHKMRKGQTLHVTLKASKKTQTSLARGRRVSERVSAKFTAKGKGATTVRSKAVRLR